MNKIYLDYAAATPLDEKVFLEMKPYFSSVFYNPSSLYSGGLKAKSGLESARHKVAILIGGKPSEIIFTAGGTESANLAVNGVMSKFIGSNIVISTIEHDAVLKSAEKYSHKKLAVDSKGRINSKDISKVCDSDTVLVSVILANNEIGTIQPIREIYYEIQNLRQSRKKTGNKKPIYFHVDACQAPLYLDINVARLGVDLMTLNGGKMYGPKQSAILYVKAGTKLNPEILGGGQEFGLRSGTENVAFAVGFAKALELATKSRAKRTEDMIMIRDYFMSELESRFDVEITGDRKNRLANNIHAVFKGVDNERVIFALDELGVSAATGSACSASKEEASHVLIAIGKNEEEARSSLRFSLGKNTTKLQIDEVIVCLKKALKA